MGSIGYDYEPVTFLRCHSKNNDSADVKTQVWHCAFEPNTEIVATCGGNSVCIIDCTAGTVRTKFYTKSDHLLFSLSWGMACFERRPENIIVSGGAKSTLYFLNPSSNICFLIHNLNLKQSVAIHALHFHPKERDLFFCGTSDGVIRAFRLTGNNDHDVSHISTITTDSEIFDLSFCLTTRSLLASCNNGLFLFHFPTEENFKQLTSFTKVLFKMPENPINPNNNSQLVDSVEVIRNGLFCVKCALHGTIYISDLKTVIAKLKKNVSSLNFKPLATLPWSHTDNYFMYMGVSPDAKWLSCGDDEGSIWLYNLPNSIDKKTEIKAEIVLQWPEIRDTYQIQKRKLALDTYDIVVDKIAMNDSAKYLVAVTNNNLVCIWKKINKKFVK